MYVLLLGVVAVPTVLYCTVYRDMLQCIDRVHITVVPALAILEVVLLRYSTVSPASCVQCRRRLDLLDVVPVLLFRS